MTNYISQEIKELIEKYKGLKKFSWLVRKIESNVNLKIETLNATAFLDEHYDNIPISQRLYHLIKNINELIKCNCGKPTGYRGSISKGYHRSCGDKKCRQLIMEETNLKKYGVESVMQVGRIKDKQMGSLIKKYGMHVLAMPDVQAKKEKLRTDRMLGRIPGKLLSRNDDFMTVEMDGCGHVVEIHKQILYNRAHLGIPICPKCYSPTQYSSFAETEIDDFVKNLGMDTVRRKRFGKLEIDIYIDAKKMGIEYNGLYYHSDIFKEKNYHKDKFIKTQELGINLIQVWEDDWIANKEMVKSRIRAKLGTSTINVNARSCKISEVSKKDYRDFLDHNHIMGKCPSEFKIGLYHESVLVSVMGFGRTRKFMGGNGKDYEMLRFCNILDTNVRGGASKLFKYFINNYWDGSRIVSYHDCSWGTNTFYEKLGFKFTGFTVPNFHYFYERVRVHRYAFNKQKLLKKGGNPAKTANEMMIEKKVPRIFGCGNARYEFNSL